MVYSFLVRRWKNVWRSVAARSAVTARDVHQLGAIDGQRERFAKVLAGRAGERTLLVVEAHPGGARLLDEFQLTRFWAGLDAQDILRRDVAVHVPESDVVEAVLVILRDRRREVGDDVHVDLL